MKDICRMLVGETSWLGGRWRIGKSYIRMCSSSIWLRMWNELNWFMICPLGGFRIGEVESWGSVEELHIREFKFQGSLEELDIFPQYQSVYSMLSLFTFGSLTTCL